MRIVTPVLVVLACLLPAAAHAQPFSVVEATIPEMQQAMADGRITSRELVEEYLIRLGLYENKLNAAIAINDEALAVAEALDRERAAGKVRGPLHGIPIAIKDNIHTTDMPTTAGTLALDGYTPPYDATLVRNLRDAGAVILAKTVLTEMANWMVLGMPNNYSAVAGFAYNPYDPRKDPRPGWDDGRGVLPTGSSSSGNGTAANLWAANVGTETVNSVIGPSNMTMLAAIKPTIGRISRWGIIPVSYDQDSAGPMTRTVTDAAIMLGAMEGYDPMDPTMTRRCRPPAGKDYTQFLDSDALRGARIGVPRAWFVEPHQLPRRDAPSGGVPQDQKEMLNDAIAILRAAGATVVDAADIPSALAEDWDDNSLVRGSCSAGPSFKDSDDECSTVLKYSFKRDVNGWFATLGGTTQVDNLTGLRQWNIDHAHRGTLRYAQHTLDISDEMDIYLEEDERRYYTDRRKDMRQAGEEGVDAALAADNLDALLFIGDRASGFLAKAGYPSVTVPFGMVNNWFGDPDAYPEGFTPKPSPRGITFSGTECSEPTLIALAYAFEQLTKRRVPPAGFD